MNTTTRLALAVALPVAAVAITGQPAFAAPPPTEPPTPDGGVVIPSDFVILTDDTGTITVGVPSSWIDVDTAPAGEDPWISAAPDFHGFVGTFDVPGVIFEAVPYTSDIATLVGDHGYAGVCAVEEVQPYDDGVFAGSHLIDTGCGDDGTTEYHVIAANPSNQAFTALLDIQITEPDQASILDGILATFNTTGGTGAPTTSVSGSPTSTLAPTTPAGPAPAVFPNPTGAVPSDWTALVDDTATLRITVPPSWTDVEVSAGTNGDGTAQPWISASTDLDVFFPPEGTDTFSVPGVDYAALPFTADTAATLASSSSHDVCTAEPVQAYDDGVFAGHIQFFDGCGGTSSRAVEIYANPANGAFTAAVFIQLTGQPDDDATLNGLLLSFNRVSADEATTTTTAATSDSDIAYIQQRLREGYGREATEEQIHCLLEDPTFDVDDPAGIRVSLMVNCGLTPFDAPSTSLERTNAVAALEQMLHDQLGVTVTDEQASCLADNARQLEPTDITAAAADPYGMPALVLVTLLDCGIDVFNIPSG